MIRQTFRVLAALLPLAILTMLPASAASFKIDGLAAVAAVKGTPPPASTAMISVVDPGNTQAWTASLEGNPVWASLSAMGGSGPGSVVITFNTAALAAGTYSTALSLNSGGTLSRQEVTVRVLVPNVFKMQTDPVRPRIYMLHRTSEESSSAGDLIIFNTDTEKVEKVVPLGTNPTDLKLNVAEQTLSVCHAAVIYPAPPAVMRVLDVRTGAEIRSVPLDMTDNWISIGKPGRIMNEGQNGMTLRNSVTGEVMATQSLSYGSGDFEPSGRYYYHCTAYSSSNRLYRFDMSADTFVPAGLSPVKEYGANKVVIAGDGGRIFWNSAGYDADLRLFRIYDEEILACTYRGELVFSSNKVYDSATGATLGTLPVTSKVAAVSADQKKLFQFNAANGTFARTLIANIRPVPAAVSAPTPPDKGGALNQLERLQWTSTAGAQSYRVFFGTDALAVSGAGTDSPLYLGETTDLEKALTSPLTPGVTYHWRLDALLPDGAVATSLWSFTVSALRAVPGELSVKAPRGAVVAQPLNISGESGGGTWTASASQPWITFSPSTVSSGGEKTLSVVMSTAGLTPGVWKGSVDLSFGGVTGSVPVTLEVFEPDIVDMIADPSSPWVYALHKGTDFSPASHVIFYHLPSRQMTGVMEVGTNASDMALNLAEKRLYINNPGSPRIQVVDLLTRTLLPPLPAPANVTKISAGRAGRIYAELGYQWADGRGVILDTATGQQIGTATDFTTMEPGEGDIDPSGRWYYHSGAPVLFKFDVSGDEWNLLGKSGLIDLFSYNRRNLVMSPDGLRFFNRNRMFDTSLSELRNLGYEVYATSLRGELAVTERGILRTRDGAEVASLPVTTPVSAVAGDQSGVVYFNPEAKTIDFMALSGAAAVPAPGTVFGPPDNSVQLLPLSGLTWDVVPGALKYLVYFGTDAAAVAAANSSSPSFAGETQELSWNLAPSQLPPGGQFFWRVDTVAQSGTATGQVRSFRTLPVTISQDTVEAKAMRDAPGFRLSLPVTGTEGASWTASLPDLPWAKLSKAGGTTGGELELAFDAAGLAVGVYSTTLTLSSGGNVAAIPVTLTVETPNFVVLKADPARPRIYAIQRTADLKGSLAVVNTATGAVERMIPLSLNPTELDLTPDNQFLYVITQRGRKIHRIDLENWTVSDQSLAPAAGEDVASTTTVYRVAAGMDSKVLWVDGAAAPRLHSVDFRTGQETAPPVSVEMSYGFGPIARTADGISLAAANSRASAGLVVDIRNGVPVPQLTGVNFTGASTTSPVVVRPDGSAVFFQRYKLAGNLTDVLKSYPAEIYAATRTPGLVFGATGAWSESTMAPAWTAPEGVDASICAVAGDQTAFFYFNKTAAALVRVPLNTMAGYPGPQPENGDILSAMPPRLSWPAVPQALRYEVYFGTDQEGVGSASGSSSPFHLGSTSELSLALTEPFRTAGAWWWRVDAVLRGGTVKGQIWSFTGALKYLDSIRTDETISILAMEGRTLMSAEPSFQPADNSGIGRVSVFSKSIGREKWAWSQTLTNPDGAAQQLTFGKSIAMHGDVAWIGAPGVWTAGRAFEFRQDSLTGRWQATGRFVEGTSTQTSAEGFGTTLAFNGTTLAVGFPSYSTAVLSAGSVEVFDAATLARQAVLTETPQVQFASYGNVMALGDGFLAVGNARRKVNAQTTGAVDIWSLGSNGTWTRTYTLVSPASGAPIALGSALAISGDLLYVGDHMTDGSLDRVFVYQKTNSPAPWRPLGPLPLSGTGPRSSIGIGLAAKDDAVLLSTPFGATSWDPYQPTIWLNRRTAGSTWTQISPLVPEPDKIRNSLAGPMALSSRYAAAALPSDSNGNVSALIFLYNPDGNLPPVFTSAPLLFAEEGRPYRLPVAAADENAGDSLKFTAADLPPWLSLADAGNGAAVLSGTPPAGSAGNVSMILEAADSHGATAHQWFELRVLPSGGLPVVTVVKGTQVADDHGPAVLSVSATGKPGTWQWYFNGNPVIGAAGSSFSIPHVQASDGGEYRARLTLPDGTWTDSDPMTLTVQEVPDRFGGDWPTFGAGPSRTGAYPATLGRHQFIPAWTIPNAGSNQVATGGGRIYMTQGGEYSDASSVSAYDLFTGAKLWSSPLPVVSSVNPPTYHRGRVYLQKGRGREGESATLICLDAATGNRIWETPFASQSDSWAAPAVDDRGVYINGGNYGGIFGFNPAGKQMFFQSLEQVDRWAPLLHQGRLYSWVYGQFRQHDPLYGGELEALNLSSQISYGAIPAAEGTSAVLNNFSEIYGVDLSGFRLLWRKLGNYAGSPSIRGGVGYFITPAGVESYNVLTGTPGQTYPLPLDTAEEMMQRHQPMILEDTVLVSSKEAIRTFDRATGAVLQDLPGGGVLTYTDGMLFAAGRDGTLRAWQVNQAPVLTANPAEMNATEDQSFSWSLGVADADGDVPVITTTGKPGWLNMGALTGNTVVFSGTPLNADNGAFSFTVTADDQKSVPVTFEVEGFVTAVNDAPAAAAAPAPVTANEDSAVPSVKIADLFSDEEDGAAGLTVVITENSNPALLSSVTISDGLLRMTAAPDAFGSTVLKLVATDSGGLTAETRVPIHILPVNDPPVAVALDANVTVDEDTAITPLQAGQLFTDIDNTVSELTLTVTGNTNPALFASVTVVDGSVRPVLAPDANGTAILTITATDPGGLSAVKEITVTVRPVNDAPVIAGVIPDISAGGSGAAAVVNFAPFVKDPDKGDTLTWRVVSNSNPGIFSRLEFDAQGGLNIAWAAYVSGRSTVTVEVSDAAGIAVQKTFSMELPAIPDPSITASATLTLNRQTGLWEQKVTVKNVGARAVGGFEITVSGLPAKAVVYNASGGTAALPVVGYYQPIAAGESVSLLLEYYVPDRSALTPQLAVTAVLPREALVSAAGTIAIDRAVMLEPGAFLFEFPAIPGELYMVQYTDEAGVWRDSLVRLRAGGNRVQWIDRGAPRTTSAPGLGKSRFYRVKHLTSP